MSEGERRLAAIMFTDIVGYTALGQKNESLALETLERHRDLLCPIFSKHRGREVKTIGDAFLIEFGSAREATLCAIDVQSRIHSLNLERGEKVFVRIGVHLGDVVHREGDVLGEFPDVLGSLGYAYAISGRRPEALNALERLALLNAKGFDSPTNVAFVHLGLGDTNQALDLLLEAFRDKESWLVFNCQNPIFDSMRSDPRFVELMKEIGLPHS